MAPQSGEAEVAGAAEVHDEIKLTSGILKYPSKRDTGLKHPDLWLKAKREDDGVYPHWRVHDKLYDFTEFAETHPGGKFWIEETRGTDITESFESSHFGPLPDRVLKKYFVKNITTPRTSSFTFHEDGFYRTLKRKVTPIFNKVGKGPTRTMLLIQDFLLCGFLFFGALSALYQRALYAVISGVFLTFMGNAAHNYFHQKDNWRMYIFDLTVVSSREWRISHAISHHNFPNTINDYEASTLEPLMVVFPKSNKTFMQRYGVYVTSIYNYVFGFHLEFARKIILTMKGVIKLQPEDFLIFLEMILMSYLSGSILQGLKYWAIVHTVGNTIFLFIGVQAAHFHPDIYKEGDIPSEDKDWGLHQVLTTRERGQAFHTYLVLVAIAFGNHTLHHLFPTVDHSKLPYVQEAFLETCKEFGVKFDVYTPWKHFKGVYAAMSSITPNKNKPSILK